MFDPDAFMQTTIEDAFEEKRSLIPAGEYMATVENLEAKTVGEANRPIINMRLRLVNTGDEETEGRVLYHTLWLDMDERGALMTGPNKNIGLGQFLSALGLNGKPWNPTMFEGQVVLIQVSHGMNKRTGEMEERIPRVAKAA